MCLTETFRVKHGPFTSYRTLLFETGSSVTETGSSVTETGSSVTETRSSVTETGSSVTDTGSSVTEMRPELIDVIKQNCSLIGRFEQSRLQDLSSSQTVVGHGTPNHTEGWRPGRDLSVAVTTDSASRDGRRFPWPP